MNQQTPDPLGAALALLFLNFPSGVTDAIKMTYLSEVRRLGFAPEIMAEAAQRILHTREQRTVPPFAIVLRTCREVQSEQLNTITDSKTYTPAGARDPALRRLKLINERAWKKIPITDENIDLHVAQMEREGIIRVAALPAGEE
jgi:hypothetical protein